MNLNDYALLLFEAKGFLSNWPKTQGGLTPRDRLLLRRTLEFLSLACDGDSAISRKKLLPARDQLEAYYIAQGALSNSDNLPHELLSTQERHRITTTIGVLQDIEQGTPLGKIKKTSYADASNLFCDLVRYSITAVNRE